MTAPGTEAERRCGEHPDRRAETPCARCGTFICDWCVKLAPSWAPGLCLPCQKRTAGVEPGRIPLTRGFIVVAAATLLCPFMTLNELGETVRLRQGTSEERLLAVAVLLLLLVWNVVAIITFIVKRQRARGVLLGFFGLRGIISLLGVAATWGQATGSWLSILVNAAVFAYIGWSDDARLVFGPKPGVTSAAEVLDDDARD